MRFSLREMFDVEKPVIGMVHFPPLPGTPLYDEASGVAGILESVGDDVEKLLDGGVDGLLFCNEGDRPYALEASPESITVMTRAISEFAPKDRPFGVDFMWEPHAPLAIAMATGAAFVRVVMTGVYDSDMGLWNTNAADLLRYRRYINASHIKLFCNITPEFAAPLGDRSVELRAHSATVSSLADAILVSGPMAGEEPDLSLLREAKAGVDGSVPVLLNTGATAENIEEFLSVADGAIVGSTLKVHGDTWNPVDLARVKAFMDTIQGVRED